MSPAAPCHDCLAVSRTNPGLAPGQTAGGFSLGSRRERSNLVIVAVGGDYKLPNQSAGTAATCTVDDRRHIRWRPSKMTPGGYRSAVAYDTNAKTWLTVGTNGTDVSTDDGRTWRPLRPTGAEPSDAGRNWNALSLPFVVGPNGRIGKLNRRALRP